jgi:nitroreductase
VNKTAETEFPILPVLAERWSPVAYSSRPVEEEKLKALFEAARWAPSCNNEQPWIFIVAPHGSERFASLADCLMEGNAWAKNAGVLVLAVARMTFERNGQPNRFGMYDTGQAVANLLTQAVAEGLFVHQMAGYDAAKARAAMALPETQDPAAMMAIGYYGDRNSLPEKSKLREEAPRQRKPQSDFVIWG